MRTEWPEPGSLPVRRPGAAGVALDDNLALYDEVGQLMILLNTSAAAVWECCDGTTTMDDMARHLALAYAADAGEVREDVHQTVRKLADLGLVVDARPGPGGPPRA